MIGMARWICTIPNGVTADTTLVEQMRAAFGASVKINGKTAKEIATKKTS